MVEIVLFVLGLAVGSFANVLIDRLPKGQSVISGRSRCDFCKKTLRFWELVPVLSFLLLHGRCFRCKRRLSIQYPLVEFAVGLMFVGLYHWANFALVPFVLLTGIFVSLLVIFVADVKYQIIPDAMVGIGVVCSLFYRVINILSPSVLVSSHILAAVLACLFFYALWLGTRGKGMGFGDVKYALFMGLFLGFPALIVGLYIAFLTGAGVGVILILIRSKTLKSKIAFGPFLVLGTVVAYFFSESIISWWYTIW